MASKQCGSNSLLVLHDEASCGIVKEINKVRLLGAENNGKVTCYLDSLLFALFARLDSFEVGERQPPLWSLTANLKRQCFTISLMTSLGGV